MLKRASKNMKNLTHDEKTAHLFNQVCFLLAMPTASHALVVGFLFVRGGVL